MNWYIWKILNITLVLTISFKVYNLKTNIEKEEVRLSTYETLKNIDSEIDQLESQKYSLKGIISNPWIYRFEASNSQE